MGRTDPKLTHRSRNILLVCTATYLAGSICVFYSVFTVRLSRWDIIFQENHGNTPLHGKLNIVGTLNAVAILLAGLDVIAVLRRRRRRFCCVRFLTGMVIVFPFVAVAWNVLPLLKTWNRWMESSTPQEAEELSLQKTFTGLYCRNPPTGWITSQCPSRTVISQWRTTPVGATKLAKNAPYIQCRPEILEFLTKSVLIGFVGCILAITGAILVALFRKSVARKLERVFDPSSDEEGDEDAPPYTPSTALVAYLQA